MRAKSLPFAFVFLLALLASLFATSRWPMRSSASNTDSVSPRQPVIVELFTSEGCSSCPPADTLLKKLSDEQPFDNIEILALEEHVDYWNSVGWNDPFSSVDFSRRQEQYAVTLPDGGVYTPQMIVDGSAQFVGNRTREARDQIRWAAARPKARLQLTAISNSNPRNRTFQLTLSAATDSAISSETRNPSSVPAPGAPHAAFACGFLGLLPTTHISIASRPDQSHLALTSESSTQDLWIALTEKNLSSHVTGGENSGELLQHAPVVRLLRKEKSVALNSSTPLTITIDLNEKWNPVNLTVIAFRSNSKSHQITAAGSLPLQP